MSTWRPVMGRVVTEMKGQGGKPDVFWFPELLDIFEVVV